MNFLAKLQNGGLNLGSDINRNRFSKFCRDNDGKFVRLELASGARIRTGQQNRALHKWFELVADELNGAGYSVQVVLKQKLEVDWTPEMVKELLWREAQKAILKKKSTTELLKQGEIDKVFDHLNRHLGEKFGVHIPFPTNEIGYWDSAPLREPPPVLYQKLLVNY